jgi:hypothetical protein
VDEIYKMLGREHQADLDREASNRALASRLAARPGLTQYAVTRFWQFATRRINDIAFPISLPDKSSSSSTTDRARLRLMHVSRFAVFRGGERQRPT